MVTRMRESVVRQDAAAPVPTPTATGEVIVAARNELHERDWELHEVAQTPSVEATGH